MDIKMICIDMDGTLLNRGKKISEYSKEIIKKVHDMGVEIVVTTGRIYNNAEYFSNLLGVKSPVIASNGAIVREKENSNVIYECSIPDNSCLGILDALIDNKLLFHVYTTDTIFCNNNLTKGLTQFYLNLQAKKEDMKLKYEVIRDKQTWKKILDENKNDITKFIAFSLKNKKIVKLRNLLESSDEVVCYGSGSHSLEINSKNVSKGSAVKALAEYYNIEAENIMCIGDNENDVSMIEYAGIGVAMGNAIDAVKKVADYITETNDEDGVAKAIKEIIIDKNKNIICN